MAAKKPSKAKDAVFIVHGRDTDALHKVQRFLQNVGLRGVTASEAGQWTDSNAPSLLDLVEAGMAHTAATVVILTGEEKTALRPELRNEGEAADRRTRLQPRPNVLLEAGMALGKDDQHTIFLQFGGDVEVPSDIGATYRTDWSSSSPNKGLLARLHHAGCAVDKKKLQSYGIERSAGRRVLKREDSPWPVDGNLVINGDFERGIMGWNSREEDCKNAKNDVTAHGVPAAIDEGAAVVGTKAVRCHLEEPLARDGLPHRAGVWQRVELPEARPEIIRATAYAKAADVTGGPDARFSLWVEFAYVGRPNADKRAAEFDVGTTDWEKREVEFSPEAAIAWLTVCLVFRAPHTGTAWFDGVSLVVE